MNFTRLDVLLLERNLAESRTKAQALIRDGQVSVAGKIIRRPGVAVATDAAIHVQPQDMDFVSRGGNKLANALDDLTIEVRGAVAFDVGASTGGFTDCLLHRGASCVYAVDVGSNQMHPRLREDGRIFLFEQTHIKDFLPAQITHKVDIIVVDVSFISLTGVIKYLPAFCSAGTTLLALIKPQFEVGRDFIGKGGIVKDEQRVNEILNAIKGECDQHSFNVKNLLPAKPKGSGGNQEYFLYAQFDAK